MATRKPRAKKLDDPDLRVRMLDLIRAGSGRYEAAQAVGVATETYRKYYRDNPDFAEEVEDAVEHSLEPVFKMLRDEAIAGDISAARELLKHHAPRPRADREADKAKAAQKKESTVTHRYELDPSSVRSIAELQARVQQRGGKAFDVIDTEEA